MPNTNHAAAISRRSLIQGTAATGIGLGAFHWLQPTSMADKISIPAEGVVLFQGDSITDAGRSRKNTGANNSQSLGHGYAMLISAQLLANHPEMNFKCFNRGISGNKVPDLEKRWQQDCIDLKPNLLSILIGVNDIWHKLGGNYDGTVKDYEAGLLALLQRTRTELPNTKIVLCEPFVLRCGAINDRWFPEFDERLAACRRVGEQMNCTWVPFQQMFDKAVEHTEPSYWAGDGVHPSLAGHTLMAKTWLETVSLS